MKEYKKETLLKTDDGVEINIDTEGIVEIKKEGTGVIKLTKNDLAFIEKVMD